MSDSSLPLDQFCQQVEAHLCRRNDGHLLRIVGPSFDVVRAWADEGIPLKVVFGGIDRTVDRLARKGPRRRPVKIDFCDADVRDAFDDWRRAVLTVGPGPGDAPAAAAPRAERRGPSLRAHLERALHKLSQGRATSVLDDTFEPVLETLSGLYDRARGDGHGVRGEARAELIGMLTELDHRMMAVARHAVGRARLAAFEQDATADLAGFRASMPPDAWAKALAGAVDQQVRATLGLPVVTF